MGYEVLNKLAKGSPLELKPVFILSGLELLQEFEGIALVDATGRNLVPFANLIEVEEVIGATTLGEKHC